MSVDEMIAWAQQHPVLAALVAAHLFFTALGNVHLSDETKARWPRLKNAVELGQKIGIVVRGATKPAIGLMLPASVKDALEGATAEKTP